MLPLRFVTALIPVFLKFRIQHIALFFRMNYFSGFYNHYLQNRNPHQLHRQRPKQKQRLGLAPHPEHLAAQEHGMAGFPVCLDADAQGNEQPHHGRAGENQRQTQPPVCFPECAVLFYSLREQGFAPNMVGRTHRQQKIPGNKPP